MQKSIKVVIVVLIALSAISLLVAATDAIDWLRDPLVEDSNVEVVMVEKTIKQGDITFTIDRLEVGDNYSTLYYEMSPYTEGEILKGAQLYHGDTPLEVISTPCSMSLGCAICFAPVEEVKNLNLHVAEVKEYSLYEEKFELQFMDNEASIPVFIGKKEGSLYVSLEDDGLSMILEGIEDLSSDKFITRTGTPADVELYIGDTSENSLPQFGKDNAPTHVKISFKEYTYEKDALIVPIF